MTAVSYSELSKFLCVWRQVQFNLHRGIPKYQIRELVPKTNLFLYVIYKDSPVIKKTFACP